MEAGFIAAASEVCGGHDSEGLRWKVTLSDIGFWVATAAKRNGNKLVGRRANGRAIMDRLESMMDARLKEIETPCPN